MIKTSHRGGPKVFMLSRLAQGVAWTTLVLIPSLALAQAGQLDSSFGKGGIFVSNFGGSSGAINALALQADGKIVVGGSGPSGPAAFGRITTSGAFDPSFGNGGVVSSTFNAQAAKAFVVALAIQADGKIVAAANGIPSRFAVGRFNPDGSVDTSFGNSGFVQVPNAGGAVLLTIQPNQDIVAVGSTQIARLTSTGQLDTTFGNGGLAVLLNLMPSAIALQSDGKILIASGAFQSPPLAELNPIPGAGTLARYNPNGSLDRSFGVSGQAASVALPSAAAVQIDGKILVAGTVVSKLIASGNATGFGVVRFNPNGSLDTTFGVQGGTATGFGSLTIAGAYGMAIQSNGDIVTAGEAGKINNNQLTLSFALARYGIAGLLDTTFGNHGTVTTGFGSNAQALITAIALQTDGKIVVAGDANSNFAVARYLSQ